jgi:hypothetical protein
MMARSAERNKMTTVNIATVTESKDFPAGTVDTSYHVTLVDTTGVVIDDVFSTDGTASFQNVKPGSYNVNVSKNGQTASTAITVTAPSVTLQVPVSVTVTLA